MDEQIDGTIKYRKILEINNLELVRGINVNHYHPLHFHGVFTVGIIESGCRICLKKGIRHLVRPGSIMVTNPGEVHSCRPVSADVYSYRILCPDIETMSLISLNGNEVREPPFFPDLIIRDEQLFRFFLDLCHALESPGSFKLEKQTLFWECMDQLIRRNSKRSTGFDKYNHEPEAIRKVREYLEDEYFNNPTIEDLSFIVGLSPYHLIRAFKREVGLPPHVFLTQIKIRKAKDLLRGGISIAQAASETGFVDQSHFTRCFKKSTGVTPGKYIVQF